MALRINEIVHKCTDDYIGKLDPAALPSPAEMSSRLCDDVATVCSLTNATQPKDDKIKAPSTLTPWQIARLMLVRYRIVHISSGRGGNPALDPLAVYVEDGTDEGLYVVSDTLLESLAYGFDATATGAKLRDVVAACSRLAPSVVRTTDRDLVPVANGIFNYTSKDLLPFSPDYVFLAKSPVRYVPNAPAPVIRNADGTEWDVDSWMRSLSDDPDIVSLLWCIMGASVRSGVRWNKAAFLYSSSGENGKGTLCEMIRGLVGEEHCASVALSRFGDDFALEPLLRASAIVVDENAVGDFAKDAAGFKAVVTNDVILVNRKHASMINFRFQGFVVQCVNELPRVKDKSDSFYRRQLFVPFDHCFTGKANTAIKDDYIHRPEVLEYVLSRVLDGPCYYELPEPVACQQLLAEYKEYNDSIRQFLAEVLPEASWDFFPYPLLYDLYKAWFADANPRGTVEGRNTFIARVDALCPLLGWRSVRTKRVTVKSDPNTLNSRMSGREMLLVKYPDDPGVKKWWNRNYSGSDLGRYAEPSPGYIAASYTGLLREGK